MSQRLRLIDRGGSSTPTTGATKWQIWKTRLRINLGMLLNRGRVPGAIQPFKYDDLLTGQRLEVRLTPLFTILTVNNRDYYFWRISGRFDGTGSGL